MSKFTESQLEQAFIELLGKEEIPHLFGQAIQRSSEEVLIKKDLKDFLLQQYKAEEITESEVESIIRDLERLPASDLYDSNKAIMKLVSDGFLLKREDRSKKDFYVQLIDYTEKDNNHYKIVNQLEIVEYIKFELTTLAYLWGFSEILILLGNKQVTISLKSNLNITCRINNPL